MQSHDQREGADCDDRADDHEPHEVVFGFHGAKHAGMERRDSLKVLTIIRCDAVNASGGCTL